MDAARCGTDVSVIVPVHRNAGTLVELYTRLRATLERERLSFELVFVDDACPEGSGAVLRELAGRDCRVQTVSLAANVGQHRAVIIGLARAQGAWSVIMDADLQDPPEALPLLLAKGRESDAWAVFAGRRGRYESGVRLLTSRLFKWVLHLLTGVPSDAGIFCAVNRPLVGRLVSMAGQRPFVVAMIGCAGAPMVSVPVERSPRLTGDSAYSSWKRIESACRGIHWALAWKLRQNTCSDD
jgi:glycosyltransferase involved in cell wall biosynthesis